MHQARLAFLACALLLAAVACGQAQAQTSPYAEPMKTAIEPFLDRHEISGAVVLVGDASGILFLEEYGLRNAESKQPMEANTLFRIASMTKPITALGIMMLVEEGKLGLDDPVEKHIPEFHGQKVVVVPPGGSPVAQEPRRPITIRDLLTHTSGLPDTAPAGAKPVTHHTLAEAVLDYAKRPLSFEPGTRWAYSNVGMATLGRLIETASGQLYQNFLNERLFHPLGMTDTTFYPTPDQMSRLAMTYTIKDGKLTPVPTSQERPTPESRIPSPAGGLYSTAPDLARLYRMILNQGTLDGHVYLKPATLAEMTRLQTGAIKTGFTENMGYGLGFGHVRKPTGVTAMLSPGTFGHGGAWGTQAWIDPVKKRFGVLLIQRTGLPNSDDSPMRKAFQKVAFQ